jgi:putative Holliday junction resolvase
VARSDAGGVLASPLETVPRNSASLTRLAALAAEHQAVEVIVGLPASLSGREGRAAADVRKLTGAIARDLAPIPVRLVDERFTTVLAHDALRARGMASRARRNAVDKAAAAVLLQGALDTERSTGEPPGTLVSPGQGEES